MTQTIEKSKAGFKLLDNTQNGRIFSVVFEKKNGERRVMLARRGVAKYVKGVGMKYNPKERGLMPVYDLHKKAYRIINLTTLLGFQINGQRYIVK
jgi:hypothetical protein